MKTLYTILLLSVAFAANATTWEVEVGGTTSQTPYYAPQHIVIQVGDIVKWKFVSGLHNVTSTSGPESFASGDKVGNPDGSVIYPRAFSLPGVYTYNCTFEGHAQFQNGSITVEGTVNIDETTTKASLDFSIWPNPASDVLNIEKSISSSVDISIKDMTGKIVWLENSVADLRREISLSSLTTGIYFVELRQRNQVVRKKLVIR